jgi:hypothetical protein
MISHQVQDTAKKTPEKSGVPLKSRVISPFFCFIVEEFFGNS